MVAMVLLCTASGWSCSSSSGSSSPQNGDGGASSSGASSGTSSGSGSTSSSGASSGSTSGGGSGSSGASSGGSSGASSGSGGSSGSSGSSGPLSPDASACSGCLGGEALAALGKNRLIFGLSTDDDPTAAAAPFDARYVYISGGLFDGTAPCASCATNCTAKSTTCANSGPGCAWWGCYQYDQDPPGEYVRNFVSNAAKSTPPQIPMFTYYEILQALQATVPPNTNVEGADEVTMAATSTSIMKRYFNDYRFMLQQIGNARAIVHIEPDFWGYAEQHASDPTTEMAAVATANSTDCGSMPNTIAGMGQCMIAMTRKYAPKTLVGLHASEWSTNTDVGLNTSKSLDVAGEAKKTAAFLAACGESSADLVIVETSDRDAGYYQSQGRNTFWDATNATLPDFHQDFAWVKALTETLGKAALYWQTPLGNANQNNTTNHWKDNRVDYFFAHPDEMAAAHAIGAVVRRGPGRPDPSGDRRRQPGGEDEGVRRGRRPASSVRGVSAHDFLKNRPKRLLSSCLAGLPDIALDRVLTV